jgi:hypothetical protein
MTKISSVALQELCLLPKVKMKKAQGMSVNTIIIAIIVLIVLVVLVLIFGGYIKGWTGSVATCSGQGGTCVDGSPGLTICQSDDGSLTSEPLNAQCPTAASGGLHICCPPGTTSSKAIIT